MPLKSFVFYIFSTSQGGLAMFPMLSGHTQLGSAVLGGQSKDQNKQGLCPHILDSLGWETNKEVNSFQRMVSVIEKIMHQNYTQTGKRV